MNKVLRFSLLVTATFSLALFVAKGLNTHALQDSIVKVLNSAGTGGGTGWVAKSHGVNVIVTNHHVCAIQEAGYVRIDAEDGRSYVKRVLRSSPQRDLCVVEGIDAPALTLSNRDPRRFDRVHVMGHPFLNPVTPVTGQYIGQAVVPFYEEVVDGRCQEGAVFTEIPTIFGLIKVCSRTQDLGMTTTAIYPGNSGSPILNEDGEVIGVINSAKQDNRGMFVPLRYLQDILAE